MVAVVDAAAEGRVVIGAAAPAGVARRLVQHHGDSGIGEAQGRGEAGEASADDVDAAGRDWMRHPPHPPAATRRAPPSPARGEGNFPHAGWPPSPLAGEGWGEGVGPEALTTSRGAAPARA